MPAVFKRPFFSLSLGDHLLIYFIEVREFGAVKIIEDVLELTGYRFSLDLFPVPRDGSENCRKNTELLVSVLYRGLKLGEESHLRATNWFQFVVFDVQGVNVCLFKVTMNIQVQLIVISKSSFAVIKCGCKKKYRKQLSKLQIDV